MKICPACAKTYGDDSLFCSLDAQQLIVVADNPAAAPPADPYIGKLFSNKYQIESLLGRGGMGAVYRATDTVLARTVAIKLLRHEFSGNESFASRFLREARAAARIEHPNAITVYDFGTLEDGSAFIVMEFIQGHSLREVLKAGLLPSLTEVKSIFGETVAAVVKAHQAGIIHRDLKPENIMLKETGGQQPQVKVVDFGLAKLKESFTQSITQLTGQGDIIGTPQYMSPEQCNGTEVDESTDIYSLGIILYEMLIGRPPFTGTAAAVLGMHLYKAVRVPEELNPDIPSTLSDLVIAMTAKKREERPTLDFVLNQLQTNVTTPLNLVSTPLLPSPEKPASAENMAPTALAVDSGSPTQIRQITPQPASIIDTPTQLAPNSQASQEAVRTAPQSENALTQQYTPQDFATQPNLNSALGAATTQVISNSGANETVAMTLPPTAAPTSALNIPPTVAFNPPQNASSNNRRKLMAAGVGALLLTIVAGAFAYLRQPTALPPPPSRVAPPATATAPPPSTSLKSSSAAETNPTSEPPTSPTIPTKSLEAPKITVTPPTNVSKPRPNLTTKNKELNIIKSDDLPDDLPENARKSKPAPQSAAPPRASAEAPEDDSLDPEDRNAIVEVTKKGIKGMAKLFRGRREKREEQKQQRLERRERFEENKFRRPLRRRLD
jgi:serine/threonine protein kinase